MTTSPRWPFIVGLAAVIGLALVLCSGLTLWWLGQNGVLPRRYETNGERIYFTATSQRGTLITADTDTGFMGPGMMMGRSRLACATCHGPDGRGGQVGAMMGGVVAPDIRYNTLTVAEHDSGHEDHPPYTDATIKRAITEGLDPAGNRLEQPMPRWSMSQADLDDLLAYLKTLR